jgi:hypothetical protein
MVLSSIAHPILLFAISGLLGFVFGFIEALRHVDFPIPYFKVCLGIACLSSSTLFYWAAQRSAMSLKWGLIACAIISVETLLLAESAILLAIPLLVTSLAYVLKRRAVKLALIHP